VLLIRSANPDKEHFEMKVAWRDPVQMEQRKDSPSAAHLISLMRHPDDHLSCAEGRLTVTAAIRGGGWGSSLRVSLD